VARPRALGSGVGWCGGPERAGRPAVRDPWLGPAAQGGRAHGGHLDVVLPSDSPFWIDHRPSAPSFCALSGRHDHRVYVARAVAQRNSACGASTAKRYRHGWHRGGAVSCFSPDGQSLVFCVATRLSYCEVGGTDPRRSPSWTEGWTRWARCPRGLAFPLTIEWSADNRLLLGGFGGIWTMPVPAVPLQPLLLADRARGEVSFTLPALLPDPSG